MLYVGVEVDIESEETLAIPGLGNTDLAGCALLLGSPSPAKTVIYIPKVSLQRLFPYLAISCLWG